MNDEQGHQATSRRQGRYVPWIVIVLLLVFMALFLVRETDLAAALLRLNAGSLVALFLIQCLFNAVTGLMLKELALLFGVRLTPLEWYGLPAVTTMGNYMTPASGGLIARAVYLNQRHGLAYPRFLSLLSSGYLVNFLVISSLGLIVVFGWHIEDTRVLPLAFFFLSVSSLILFLLHRPVPLPAGEGRLKRFLRDVAGGWPLMRSRPALIGKLIALSLMNIVLGAGSLWLAYDALGYPVPGADALLVSLLQAFSSLASVTPGNLGVLEGIISLSSGLLGHGLGAGLLAALVIRAVTILFILFHGPLFSYLLSRELAGAAGVAGKSSKASGLETKKAP